MEKYIKYGQKKEVDYLEIKSYVSNHTQISINNKELENISTGFNKLNAVRVIKKGKFGFAYSSNKKLKELIDEAIKRSETSKVSLNLRLSPPNKADYKVKTKISFQRPIEEKIKDLMHLAKLRSDPKISLLKLNYADVHTNLKITTSEGSEFSIDSSVGKLISTAFAQEGSRTESYTTTNFQRKGYEFMSKSRDLVKTSLDMAKKMLNAKPAKGGRFKIIIDPELAGVFAHESVGHACEADSILSKTSILKNHLGKKLADTGLFLTDNSRLKKFGWTPFDSEGVKGKKTKLIEDGFLTNYMHSRETAYKMDAELTGNGRADDLSSRPIPRMTNTYIEKGNSTFDEMLSEIKEGYYLKGSKGGQVNTSTGEFVFNAKIGYVVNNGEIKELVKSVTLLGNILETLKRIRLIAKDLKFYAGYCGKMNQTVPVSIGSPHLLVEDSLVGGE